MKPLKIDVWPFMNLPRRTEWALTTNQVSSHLVQDRTVASADYPNVLKNVKTTKRKGRIMPKNNYEDGSELHR